MWKTYVLVLVVLLSEISFAERFEPKLGPWYEMPKYIKRSVEGFVNSYSWDKFGVDKTVKPEKLFCQGANLPMKFQVCFLYDPDVQRYPFMIVEYKTNDKAMSFYFAGAKGYFSSKGIIADGKVHKICLDLRGIEAEFLETFMVQLISKEHKLCWAQIKDIYFQTDKPKGIAIVDVPLRKSAGAEQNSNVKMINFGGGEGWRGRPTWSARMEHYTLQVMKNGNLLLKCWGAGYNMKFANRWKRDIIDLSGYSWAKVRMRCNSITANTDYFLIFTPTASSGIVNLMLQKDVIADGRWHDYLIPYSGKGKCKVCAVQVIPGSIKPAIVEMKPIMFLPKDKVSLRDFLSSKLTDGLSKAQNVVKVDVNRYAKLPIGFALERVRLAKLGIVGRLKDIFGTEPKRVVECGTPIRQGDWIDVGVKGNELYLLMLSRLPLSVPHPYQLGTSFSQWQISSPADMYVELRYEDGASEKVFPYKPGMGFRVTFGPGVYVLPMQNKKLKAFRIVNNMEHGRFYLVSAAVNKGKGIWKDEIITKASVWKDFPYYGKAKRISNDKKVGIVLKDIRKSRAITNGGKYFLKTRYGTFAVSGVDVERGGNQTIIYTNRFYRGPKTRTNRYGIEVIVLNDKIVRVVEEGNNLIPPGGYVISVHIGQKNRQVWRSMRKLKVGDDIRIVDSNDREVAVYDVNKQAIIETGTGKFVIDLSDGVRWKNIESAYLPAGFKLSDELFRLEIQSGRLAILKSKLNNTPEKYNKWQEIGKWIKSGEENYSSLDMKVDSVLKSIDKAGREYLQIEGNIDCARIKLILTADVRGLEVAGKIYNLSEDDEKLFNIELPIVSGAVSGNELWAFMPASVGGALTGKDVSLNVQIGGYLRNRIYGIFERNSGKSLYFHHTSRAAPIYNRIAILQKGAGKAKLAAKTVTIFCYPKGKAEIYPVLIGLTDRGWRGICDEYISWRDSWFKSPKVEDWFRKCFLLDHYHMLSFPPGGPFLHIGDKTGLLRLDELIDEFRKFAGGVDIIDVYDWMCWRSWDDQCGDYERYTPYKNVAMFRKAVDIAHKMGSWVGLFIATKLCYEYQNQWNTIAGTRSLVVTDKGSWRRNCGTYMPCSDTEVWRKYLAEVCARGIKQTGADLLYLDQCGDGEECWGVTHGHQPGAMVRDIELLHDLHKYAGRDVKLYLEGAMADYALEDFDACIPSAVRFGNESSMPGRIEFQRFFYPYIKFMPHHTFQQGVRDGFHWGYGFNFFQGMGYFVACVPSQWDTAGREFIKKIYGIEHKYWRVFTSDDIEPLVPTLQPWIFANRFTADGLTIYTLYNDSFIGGNTKVLKVSAGRKYFDLWNNRKLIPETVNGMEVISVDIEPKGFGAILVKEKK